ncbi:hypothetical protein [Fructilactobacillus lindneri]|nr:hypothetical protein [Fructilactobacillus lindneri]SJZ94213.1 hypothetical protein SAMN02746042_00871 [Fructilactobacillus lindneri DSM 20690 = JCM 11027]
MKIFYWCMAAFWVLTLVVMLFPMGMMPAMYMMIAGMLVHSIVCAVRQK